MVSDSLDTSSAEAIYAGSSALRSPSLSKKKKKTQCSTYYALGAVSYLLCSKQCQHIVEGPNCGGEHDRAIVTVVSYVHEYVCIVEYELVELF